MRIIWQITLETNDFGFEVERSFKEGHFINLVLSRDKGQVNWLKFMNLLMKIWKQGAIITV